MKLLLLLGIGCLGFEVSIKKFGAQCFGQELSEGTLYVGDVSMKEKRPDFRHLNIRVTDKEGAPLVEKLGVNSAKFSFTSLQSGVHNLCIENKSNFEQNVNVKVQTGAAAKDYSAMASTKDLRESEVRLKRIQDSTKQIHKEIQYIREREEQMRSTNETIHMRVIAYSICTLALLGGLAVVQMLYLKKFFKSKKMI